MIVKGIVRASDAHLAVRRTVPPRRAIVLDQVAAPPHVAWAELDRILPLATCSARFNRELRNAEFPVLPHIGHVPMWDDTRLVVTTITDWVDAHLPKPEAGNLSMASEPAS